MTGFLLAGIGARTATNGANFFVVSPEKTTTKDIENAFHQMSNRSDIAVILINQNIASQIRPVLQEYEKIIPTVLEIPSKDLPYDESSDPIMQRVLGLLGQRN